MTARFAWILDSGGAGRGAWQGGVLHEFMHWTRVNGSYPDVMMGASAGGYAAADVATGTEHTVMKGWTAWGVPRVPEQYPLSPEVQQHWPPSRFRRHLHASIRYVMDSAEVDGVFSPTEGRKLLVFTTRVRRRDGAALGRADAWRLFLQAATRKLPRSLKYLPYDTYQLDPVVFATNLPTELESEFVRPLFRESYHWAIEASCLVPVAMGPPLPPRLVSPQRAHPQDEDAVFIDGGFTLKMPMAALARDARLSALSSWAAAERTVVFCCDPNGRLWETSLRLRALNDDPVVITGLADRRLLVIHPDHEVEAGFLCLDPAETMRTFDRGRAQGRRLLASPDVKRFLAGCA